MDMTWLLGFSFGYSQAIWKFPFTDRPLFLINFSTTQKKFFIFKFKYKCFCNHKYIIYFMLLTDR
jgi:hypothetical protein